VYVRLDIDRVEPVFGGQAFGATGPYQKIVGKMRGAVDPAHRLNRIIVNLDKAPTNADGLVDYACDFYLLKPVETGRGNRRLLLDVLNRGNKVALHTLNDAVRNPDGGVRIACNEPTALDDAGNGFLMREGYTLLWCGWQGGGVPQGEGRMSASFPVATDSDGAIAGLSREEFVFEHLADPTIAQLSYPAATLDQAPCSLTVRERERDPRIAMAASQWRFLSPSQIEIARAREFGASAIYEFVYPARDPIIMGLGFAVVRDLVDWLRRDPADAQGARNPLELDGQPAVDYAYAYGMSQAGRFLRDFLYQGFNESLRGGKIFDGVMACMAGSRKSFVNAAFAQPNRFSRQHEDRLFPGDQFPFTYATTIDPVSGRTDGILERCIASDTCPRIIQTESSADFFQGRAALLASDGRGGEVAVPDGVRLYHLAGVPHGGGDPTLDYGRMFPAIAYAPNRVDCAHVHRALLVALDRWVTADMAPPPSQFPSVREGMLVSASEDYGFPRIPDATYPGIVNELCELDHSVQPPRPVPGHDYQVLVPAIDTDGNEISGVRLPDIAVPLGTCTGWTMRRPGHAEGDLGATGSVFPFAATRAARLAVGDPRLSLEERYASADEYVRQVIAAAHDLAARGLLLEEDVNRIEAAARARSKNWR